MMADADSTYLLLGLGLLGLGLVFLVLELFIPSGGLLTLLVIACVAASGVSIFLWDSTVGLAYVLLLIAIAPFAVVQGVKWWSTSRFGKRATLAAELGDSESDAALNASKSELPLSSLIGKFGRTETPLRPSGFVRVEGRRMDAVAEGRMIDGGEDIEVIGCTEGHLRVRRPWKGDTNTSSGIIHPS